MFHVSHTHAFCVCVFFKEIDVYEVCRKFTFSLIFVEIGSIDIMAVVFETPCHGVSCQELFFSMITYYFRR